MKRLRKKLNNPLIIIPPLVLVLWFAWHQYAQAGRNLSVPAQNLNLLTAHSVAQAGNTIPDTWELAQSDDASATLSHEPGYATSNATTVTVSAYTNGDITLTSPKIPVSPHQKYLFKSYYTTDVRFALIAHYYYTDGTDERIRINTYQPKKGWWSTAAHAFDSTSRVKAIQFVYKLGGTGKLTIDGAYLEPKRDITVTPTEQKGANIVPNPTLSSGDFNIPTDWSTYKSGDNSAGFAVEHDDKGPYLKANITDYKNGEAKWQHTPLTVTPHRRYQFSVQYRSDAYIKIIAEYLLSDGTRKFDTIAEILPAGEWTEADYTVEAPSGAVSLNVSLVLNSYGMVASRHYSLTDITKPGALTWRRPLVSLTFDDGWRSVYKNALSLLKRYGYLGTFYINPLNIETPDFMYASELTVLNKNHHEIAAHGYSHKDLSTLSADALNRQLSDGKNYLAQAGFPPTSFATPYGKSDPEVEWYARKYFSSSRSLETGINTRQNFDAYNVLAYFVDQETTPERISQMLDEAKQSHGWLVLVYHNIGDDPTSDTPLAAQRSTISADAFSKQLIQIQKSGISVEPVRNALAEVRNQ